MTIFTVAAAIAAIAQALPPVVISTNVSLSFHASDPLPPKIDTAEMPLVYTLTGAATDSSDAGEDFDRETRLYLVQCAVLKVGQGTPDERETRGRPLLIALKDALKAAPHLGTAFVEQARVLGDSGIVVLNEYDGLNIGFQISVSVIERVPRLYADNE